MKSKSLVLLGAALCSFFTAVNPVFAQGTAFTYQGRLTDNGSVANGTYDLRFTIFDAATSGNAVSGVVTNAGADVSSGLFIVTLDFGAGVFNGADRWVEISVRTNGGGAFATLTPRQSLIATPYAIMAGDVTSTNVARLNVPNTAQQATGVPVLTGNFITSANVTFGGSGYTTPPTVTVNDTTGSGAVITATVSNGSVVSLTVQDTGMNYSSGATLTIGLPPSNAFQTFPGPNFFINPGNTFAGDGSGLTGLWRTSGNAGTTPGTQFMGTTDNKALEFKVNNRRALRLEPDFTLNASPNVIGGTHKNYVAAGIIGATISGGGGALISGGGGGALIGNSNSISADYGTIGGGEANTIGFNPFGANAHTIGGGQNNTIGAGQATDFGGTDANTIGGGWFNYIGIDSKYSTIGGGHENTNTGLYATIPGGSQNVARNYYSFAAGRRAKANHTGAFVWADSQNADFLSTADNQFNIRASGGVGIGTNNPATALHVNGSARVEGNATVGGNASISGLFGLSSTTFAPVAGDMITPTNSFIRLLPAAVITLGSPSIANGSTVGAILILQGTSDANTVTINDNTNVRLGGNRALGLDDQLMLIWDGSDWVELSYANN